MKDFAVKLYSKRNWKSTREAYLRKVGGLCEVCLKRGIYTPAVIVHHKVEVTPDTIDDPTVTLNHDNFLAVCRKCHADLHRGESRRPKDITEQMIKPKSATSKKRYEVDDVTGAVKILE